MNSDMLNQFTPASTRGSGAKLQTADSAMDVGLYRGWQRVSAGRLKVFRSLQHWLAEFRLYRRDEKGKVVKERDHLMDATRYLCMTLLNIVKTEPNQESLEWPVNRGFRGGGSWMS